VKRYVYLFTLILSLSLVLIACSSDNTDSSTEGKENGNEQDVKQEVKKVDQTLLIANDQEPAGLDPHKVPAHSSIRIYEKVYDSLLRLDENMDLQSELALEWDQPDDVTYVFTLREGVQFHNGREMTAEDVKYSFERIMNPDTASIAKSYFSKVESIEVVNPYTVKFTLSEPFAPFLSYIASVNAAIVPQEVVTENEDLMQVAVGTGPFKFVEWKPDNHVKLVKNENYFIEGQPKLDGVTYLTMKDESSRLAAIRTGEVHLTTLSSQSIPLVEKNADLEISSYQSSEYSYLGFNMTKEPFNNQKVRQAFSLAVNRQEIADIVWKGDAVISGAVPPSLGKWAIDVKKEEMYQQNIEKAKQLLDEAGYPNGFETVISTASTYPDMIETAQLLQEQLKAIGIDASIEQLEWGKYVDAWIHGDHQMLVGRNGAGTDPDRALGFFFATEGSANVWGFSNDQYDELIEQGRTTIDESERVAIYHNAQKQLIDLSPNLFFVSPEKFFVVRNTIEGFNPTPNDPENFLETTIQ
jgi:peptide/nickel transport system substrate-binding protein